MFEVFESHFILLIEDSASRSIIEVFKFDKCLLRNDIYLLLQLQFGHLRIVHTIIII